MCTLCFRTLKIILLNLTYIFLEIPNIHMCDLMEPMRGIEGKC